MGNDASQPMRLREALPKLSDQLVPSAEYYRKAGETANEIFDMLRKNRNDVDRVEVGGSIGKRTAISIDRIPGVRGIGPPDIDVVVYLNGKEPPFRDVLSEFITIFRKRREITIKNSADYNFVCIEYSGYKIDVAPATNFRYGILLSLLVGDTQQSEILKIIERSEDKRKTCRVHGSGLVEYAVDFMKEQPAIVHALIRLAKLWNSRIQIQGYVYARSYLIECVAIHAFRQTGNYNLLAMYVNFLKSMQGFHSLQVNLQKVTIPQYIRNRRPLILDPINPYNNLAWQRPEVISEFQRAATDSLYNLRTHTGEDYGNSVVVESIQELVRILNPNSY